MPAQRPLRLIRTTPSSPVRALLGACAAAIIAVCSLAFGVGRAAPASAATACAGTWHVQKSADTGDGGDSLTAVTALDRNDIWAVGYQETTTTNAPLIEHWDGASWALVDTSALPANSHLYGVTATASDDVWAVGTVFGHRDASLMAHWDGSSWSAVASPNPSKLSNQLSAVDAASATDVWAVGSDIDNATGAFVGLIEHWNGTAWRAVRSPSLSSHDGLVGVRAVARDDVWAVGSTQAHSEGDTLAEHWDGSAWTIVASSDGASVAELSAVTSTGPNSVWAAGDAFDASVGTLDARIERWDGSQWTLQQDISDGVAGYLLAIRAWDDADVWTVGRTTSTDGTPQPVSEHWNGSAWSSVQVPTLPNGAELDGVAPVSSSRVVAVGTQNPWGGPARTLVEVYC